MIKKSFLTLTALLFSLALTEVFLRVYLWQTRVIETTACRQADPLLHHSLRPNATCRWRTLEWDVTFSTNSLGLRDKEIDPNRPLILLVGDSFLEGQGVNNDQTVAPLIESFLATDQPDIQVINAGVASYSPLLEYFYLKYRGLDLKPLHVIQFIDQNDFYDDYIYSQELTTATISAQPIWQPILFREKIPQEQSLGLPLSTDLKQFLHTHFQTYHLVSTAAKQTLRRLRHQPPPALVDIGSYNNDRLIVTRPQYLQAITDLGPQLLAHINATHQLLADQHITHTVVLYPYGHQINAQEWAQGKILQGFQPNEIVPTTALDYLQTQLQAIDIPVINLTPAFTNSDQHPLFYSNEGHWTLAANHLVAHHLATYLLSNLTP